MTQEQINGIVAILALVRPAPGRGRMRATCPAITPALASDPGLELPAAREPLSGLRVVGAGRSSSGG
jgi:hypothetical protein